MTQHCGIVALLGESNAGKSSLLNAYARKPFAEVHHKRNLTREPMRAVVTAGERQLVLEDTAGLEQKARGEVSARRREESFGVARRADLVLWIVDAARGEKAIIAHLQHLQHLQNQEEETKENDGTAQRKMFVALNKVDLLRDKRVLLPLVLLLTQGRETSLVCQDVFMLSCKNGEGIERARETLLRALPQAPFLYERDGDTRTPSSVACEATRTALYERLHDELPYEAVVACERCERQEDGAWLVAQTIVMRRESQRQILLAREARLLKIIQERAQKALQRRFDAKVDLQLHLPRPRQR